MASIYKRSYRDKDGNKKFTQAYYVKYVDGNGDTQRVKGFPNKEKTRVLAAKLEAEAANGPNPYAKHQKRQLSEHITDFRTSLESKEGTQKHVDKTISRLQAIIDGCKFSLYSDIDAPKVESWLAEQRGPDFGVKTSNYYLQAIKQFCKWMVANKRASESPVAHLSRLNAEVDVRVKRRALTADEFDRLIVATASGEENRKLTGQQRALLYIFASATGLRASEIHSLTASSFDLQAAPPVVNVKAKSSKRRKFDTVPLPEWLVELLAPVLAKSEEGIWPGNWQERAAEMLRHDLAAARQAWLKEVEKDEEETKRRLESDFLMPETTSGTADFHALRGQFITGLARAGVHPRVAQQLARHSDVKLTMQNYTHADLGDLADASNKLKQPNWPKNWPMDFGNIEHFASSPVIASYGGDIERKASKPLQNKGLDAVCHRVTSPVKGRPGGARTPDQGIMSPLL